jgi:hypothetical protein
MLECSFSTKLPASPESPASSACFTSEEILICRSASASVDLMKPGCRSEETASSLTRSLAYGLMQIARHVIGCPSIQEPRAQDAFDDVANTIHESPYLGLLHAVAHVADQGLQLGKQPRLAAGLLRMSTGASSGCHRGVMGVSWGVTGVSQGCHMGIIGVYARQPCLVRRQLRQRGLLEVRAHRRVVHGVLARRQLAPLLRQREDLVRAHPGEEMRAAFPILPRRPRRGLLVVRQVARRPRHPGTYMLHVGLGCQLDTRRTTDATESWGWVATCQLYTRPLFGLK